MRKKKVVATPVDFSAEYNVVCFNCENVFQPRAKSSLWWQAKQRADNGKLDALCVTGEECGCIKRMRRPNAPFRVFGFNDLCEDFDIGFESFVAAVRTALLEARQGSTVFLEGVSDAVAERVSHAW